MGPARYPHWQMMGPNTKYQGTPRRQQKQCNNNWIVYLSGVMIPDLSATQTKHKHWGTPDHDNRGAGKATPSVTFNGDVVERTSHLRYLGIYCDKMRTYRQHVETTLKCKKGLSVLKAMASKGIKQCHLFLLYQSVMLIVPYYDLGLTKRTQTNLVKLDTVQN